MIKIFKKQRKWLVSKYRKIRDYLVSKSKFLAKLYYYGKNPYFLERPIKRVEDDFIGFDAQVDALFTNIKEGARMISVVSDYGSGKSSLVDLLKSKLCLLKYKVIKINLWNVEEGDTEDLHSQFLFQLTKGLRKRRLIYLTKKLNSNYKNASISFKNFSSYVLFAVALFFFVISFLNSKGYMDIFNVFSRLGWKSWSKVFEFLCNFSSLLGLVFAILSVIKSDILFSYSKGDDNTRSINKSEIIETYINTFRKFGRNVVIVIEDLDRLEKGTIQEFLKQIYTYYVHSNSKKVAFIVAFKPEDYFDKMEEHYKVFDFTVDLKSLKSSDLWEVFSSLLRTKEDIVKYKYGIDFSGSNIDKWMWLARGKNLNLRQVKQRYNETLLQYATLKTRFSDRSGIRVESCIAFSYLKSEYPRFYGIIIQTDGYVKPILRLLVDKFLKSDRVPLSRDEFWGSLAKEEYEFTHRFMQDVYDLIRNGYITDNFEIYAYNYPKINHVFTQSEEVFYHAFLYGDDIEDLDLIVSDVINNKEFIDTTLDRVHELGLAYPDFIFDNELLFKLLYTNASSDEKEKIFREKLSISQHTFVKTTNNLRKICEYKVVNSDFLRFYFSIIRDKFREDYDDYALCNVRKVLLEIFNDYKESFIILYSDDFPSPNKEECDIIGDFSLILEYFANSNKTSITTFSTFILDNYNPAYFNELFKYLNSLDLELLIQFLNSVSERLFSKSLNSHKKKLLDMFYAKGAFNGADSLNCTKLFVTKIKYLNSFLGEMLLFHLDTFINKEEFCDILNNFKELPTNLLNYVSSVNFSYDYPFSPSLQNFFYKRKKYLAYLRAKVSYEGKLVFEENKINDLKNTYFSLIEDLDLFQEFNKYLNKNRKFIYYYKENKLYEKFNDERLLLFSNIAQDYDLLEYVFKNTKNSLELDEYIMNVANIRLLMVEWEALIRNNALKMSSLCSEAKEHIKKYMSTTSKKRFAEFCEDGNVIFK